MAFIRNWFSNMLNLDEPMVVDGIYYNTVENWYQAQKSTDPIIHKKIAAMNPYEAKKFGRTIKMRPDWDKVKLDIMLAGLRAKFQYGTHWYKILMDTGQLPIVENNNWGDTFWGVCNGVGENHLGRMLMEIRQWHMDNPKE